MDWSRCLASHFGHRGVRYLGLCPDHACIEKWYLKFSSLYCLSYYNNIQLNFGCNEHRRAQGIIGSEMQSGYTEHLKRWSYRGDGLELKILRRT